MELAQIVSSEKIDKKKVEEEIEKGKYHDDMLAVNSKRKVVRNDE